MLQYVERAHLLVRGVGYRPGGDIQVVKDVGSKSRIGVQPCVAGKRLWSTTNIKPGRRHGGAGFRYSLSPRIILLKGLGGSDEGAACTSLALGSSNRCLRLKGDRKQRGEFRRMDLGPRRMWLAPDETSPGAVKRCEEGAHEDDRCSERCAETKHRHFVASQGWQVDALPA